MSISQQKNHKTVSEERNMADSFIGKLDIGELLTGTPTVAEVTTGDLTITNIAVNIATLILNGKTVLPGQAVQFKVTGGLAGIDYIIRISIGTDANPAQLLFGKVTLLVLGD